MIPFYIPDKLIIIECVVTSTCDFAENKFLCTNENVYQLIMQCACPINWALIGDHMVYQDSWQGLSTTLSSEICETMLIINMNVTSLR